MQESREISVSRKHSFIVKKKQVKFVKQIASVWPQLIVY